MTDTSNQRAISAAKRNERREQIIKARPRAAPIKPKVLAVTPVKPASGASASIDAAVARERARVEAERAKFSGKPKPTLTAKAPVAIREHDRAPDLAAAKAGVSAAYARRDKARSEFADKITSALADLQRAVAGLEKRVATKANIRIVEGPTSQPDTQPRDTLSDKIGFSIRKEAAPSVVRFPQNSTRKSADANDPLDALSVTLGVRARKQERGPEIIGYVRADAPRTEEFKQRFAKARATELRWEGTQGRGALRGVIHDLSDGDTVLLEKIADLATIANLGKVLREIEEKGAHVVALDGSADTRTEKGRAALAHKIVTARSLMSLG